MQEQEITKRPTKTNYCLLTALLPQYTPETRGFTTAAEAKLIKEQLEIECRDVMSLRNLRDFVVMYLSNCNEAHALVNMDRISAITAIIDRQIVKLGGEV